MFDHPTKRHEVERSVDEALLKYSSLPTLDDIESLRHMIGLTTFGILLDDRPSSAQLIQMLQLDFAANILFQDKKEPFDLYLPKNEEDLNSLRDSVLGLCERFYDYPDLEEYMDIAIIRVIVSLLIDKTALTSLIRMTKKGHKPGIAFKDKDEYLIASTTTPSYTLGCSYNEIASRFSGVISEDVLYLLEAIGLTVRLLTEYEFRERSFYNFSGRFASTLLFTPTRKELEHEVTVGHWRGEAGIQITPLMQPNDRIGAQFILPVPKASCLCTLLEFE